MVHGLLAALVTGKNLGGEALAGARDTHTGEPADLREIGVQECRARPLNYWRAWPFFTIALAQCANTGAVRPCRLNCTNMACRHSAANPCSSSRYPA